MTAYQPLTAKNKLEPDHSIVEEKCPMVQFVELIAGKWAIPILYRLIVTAVPIRFGELQRAIAPITQKELTRQLRAFEQRGLVYRKVYAEVPPRVEYQITALGKTLQPTLDSLAQWMRDHHKALAGNS
ncbi:winged helix-turn-helix transcriptional regulator [Yersinia intermedia]|jgi:DNA-binding HxlR family transcriptional regulator|uniref:winged helix-turn-helix transcriptional regulator n=1 Tax=Yersinia intermedia TaxID=631 RepID=UPI0005DBB9AB|nr:helix-turn-helix domain-containing protein [Yersinia intermedia]MCW8112944.1 helix-turn-helix transcriptional regulator [Yersinia intermedia]MDA5483285.1 helix-turn-helix domain-containing protein [Yersinia intermedia]MDA5517887.1 helix-turn-helix domain-containing protein [Yersinia intermedia]MDN0115534.1 helix-turn-helix domain-containing protein [Yersinia intermedia]OVZ77303.1 transcriptional regulator [Yersinia intermedia]